MIKKILLLISFMFCLLAIASGQTYTRINYVDRFDDVLKTDVVKTIITKEANTIVVETKGRQKQVYHIVAPIYDECIGDSKNPVRLYGNTYGYQMCWRVVREKDWKEYQKELMQGMFKDSDRDPREEYVIGRAGDFAKLNAIFKKYTLVIVHRVFTEKYSNKYIDKILWVEDETSSILGNGINKIIYTVE